MRNETLKVNHRKKMMYNGRYYPSELYWKLIVVKDFKYGNKTEEGVS